MKEKNSSQYWSSRRGRVPRSLMGGRKRKKIETPPLACICACAMLHSWLWKSRAELTPQRSESRPYTRGTACVWNHVPGLIRSSVLLRRQMCAPLWPQHAATRRCSEDAHLREKGGSNLDPVPTAARMALVVWPHSFFLPGYSDPFLPWVEEKMARPRGSLPPSSSG